mgnify:CR=1 FL=1
MNARQVRYKKTGKNAVKISFERSRKHTALMQTIPGCKLHTSGYWTCPVTYKTVQKLYDNGFELDQALQMYLFNKPTDISIPAPKIKFRNKLELRKYQRQGVGFVDLMGGRALIADDMGLGKTIQAIAYLQHHPEIRPAIIIVPGCVKYKWAREIIKWMTKSVRGKVQILEGRTPNKKIYGDIIIVNYDIIHYWRKALYKYKFRITIMDEVQYIKEYGNKRTNACLNIGKKTRYLIGLSGTPIESRPMELYNFVNLAKPKLFKNRMEFGIKFCAGKHTGYEWDFKGASNTLVLNKILRENVMIRRLKKEVLKELPDITYSVVPFDITNRKEYDAAKKDTIAFLLETQGLHAAAAAERAETLTKLNLLKQLVAQGKIPQMTDYIQDLLLVKEKVVVACWHSVIINDLYKHFGSLALKIDGKVRNKDKIAQQFQTDPSKKICIINMKAGGVGLDLFVAEAIIVGEYPWNPSIMHQAIARVHRMGQKKKVTAHLAIALDTIEEKLIEILHQKQQTLDQVLDGQQTEEVEVIGELIKYILNS